MPWIRFTKPYSWVPPDRPMVSIAYKPSAQPVLVTTPCAEAAILAGKAERTMKPKGDRDAGG